MGALSSVGRATDF